MDDQAPKRVIHDRRMQEILGEHMDKMETMVESRRISLENTPKGGPRTLKRSVAVLVWEEPDGTECTEVVGEEGDSYLDLKGLLHDGIYLLAHAGEEGYVPR